jgi:phthiodiolone/phenolphthiodiolone dimycocerosates ketoreductase
VGQLKVGILLPCVHPLASSEEALRSAEAMDADSIWMPDHLLGFLHPDLWSECPASAFSSDPDGWLDPFCLAAALSSRTELPLGLAVTDSTRRRAPDVARSALTLHHLCRGGFNLGIGSGEAESLVPFGYDFDKPVARCEEFLRELRSLLDTGSMPQGGPGRMGIPLESEKGRPKVWIGGHGPRMLRLTGQYGDGWLPVWRTEPEEYAARRSVVERHAKAAGRPMPECGLLASVILGECRDRLAELFETAAVSKLAAVFIEGEKWQRYGLDHPSGVDSRGLIDTVIHTLDADELRELAPKIPFELLEEGYYIGNADEVFPQLEAFARAGMEHIVLANFMGLVGGLPEIEKFRSELFRLTKMLAEI